MHPSKREDMGVKMPIFKLQAMGCIVGLFKTREKLNNAIDKILKDNPDAKSSIQVWIVWD